MGAKTARHHLLLHPRGGRNMSIDSMLQRLDSVKATGRGRWQARCPSHEDNSPSLSLKLEDDGRILIHCFAGCDTADVVASVGLSLSELFPRSDIPGHSRKPVAKPFNAHDALSALALEALIVLHCANHLATNGPLSEADHRRLLTSACRFQRGLEVCTRG